MARDTKQVGAQYKKEFDAILEQLGELEKFKWKRPKSITVAETWVVFRHIFGLKDLCRHVMDFQGVISEVPQQIDLYTSASSSQSLANLLNRFQLLLDNTKKQLEPLLTLREKRQEAKSASAASTEAQEAEAVSVELDEVQRLLDLTKAQLGSLLSQNRKEARHAPSQAALAAGNTESPGATIPPAPALASSLTGGITRAPQLESKPAPDQPGNTALLESGLVPIQPQVAGKTSSLQILAKLLGFGGSLEDITFEKWFTAILAPRGAEGMSPLQTAVTARRDATRDIMLQVIKLHPAGWQAALMVPREVKDSTPTNPAAALSDISPSSGPKRETPLYQAASLTRADLLEAMLVGAGCLPMGVPSKVEAWRAAIKVAGATPAIATMDEVYIQLFTQAIEKPASRDPDMGLKKAIIDSAFLPASSALGASPNGDIYRQILLSSFLQPAWTWALIPLTNEQEAVEILLQLEKKKLLLPGTKIGDEHCAAMRKSPQHAACLAQALLIFDKNKQSDESENEAVRALMLANPEHAQTIVKQWPTLRMKLQASSLQLLPFFIHHVELLIRLEKQKLLSPDTEAGKKNCAAIRQFPQHAARLAEGLLILEKNKQPEEPENERIRALMLAYPEHAEPIVRQWSTLRKLQDPSLQLLPFFIHRVELLIRLEEQKLLSPDTEAGKKNCAAIRQFPQHAESLAQALLILAENEQLGGPANTDAVRLLILDHPKDAYAIAGHWVCVLQQLQAVGLLRGERADHNQQVIIKYIGEILLNSPRPHHDLMDVEEHLKFLLSVDDAQDELDFLFTQVKYVPFFLKGWGVLWRDKLINHQSGSKDFRQELAAAGCHAESMAEMLEHLKWSGLLAGKAGEENRRKLRQVAPHAKRLLPIVAWARAELRLWLLQSQPIFDLMIEHCPSTSFIKALDKLWSPCWYDLSAEEMVANIQTISEAGEHAVAVVEVLEILKKYHLLKGKAGKQNRQTLLKYAAQAAYTAKILGELLIDSSRIPNSALPQACFDVVLKYSAEESKKPRAGPNLDCPMNGFNILDVMNTAGLLEDTCREANLKQLLPHIRHAHTIFLELEAIKLKKPSFFFGGKQQENNQSYFNSLVRDVPVRRFKPRCFSATWRILETHGLLKEKNGQANFTRVTEVWNAFARPDASWELYKYFNQTLQTALQAAGDKQAQFEAVMPKTLNTIISMGEQRLRESRLFQNDQAKCEVYRKIINAHPTQADYLARALIILTEAQLITRAEPYNVNLRRPPTSETEAEVNLIEYLAFMEHIVLILELWQSLGAGKVASVSIKALFEFIGKQSAGQINLALQCLAAACQELKSVGRLNEETFKDLCQKPNISRATVVAMRGSELSDGNNIFNRGRADIARLGVALAGKEPGRPPIFYWLTASFLAVESNAFLDKSREKNCQARLKWIAERNPRSKSSGPMTCGVSLESKRQNTSSPASAEAAAFTAPGRHSLLASPPPIPGPAPLSLAGSPPSAGPGPGSRSLEYTPSNP